jgi:hypothetical protein
MILLNTFNISRFFAVTLLAGLYTLSYGAEVLPPNSGVIAIASQPVNALTTSLSGKVINRTIGVGQPVYLNDQINTGSNARVQILLNDQSVFNLGPNSSLVLDKFIYDPSSSQLNVSIKKGAFKFISGKISNNNPDAMKVNLPNATISVRGTGVAGDVSPDGSSVVALLHGTVSVTSTSQGSGSAVLSKSGWGVQVGTQGAVSVPALLPPDTLRGITQKVDLRASSGGGNQNVNSTQPAVAQNNLQTNSGLSAAELSNSVDASKFVSASVAQSFKSSLMSAINTQTALNGNSNMLSSQVLNDVIRNNPEVWAGILQAFGMPAGTPLPESTLTQFINSDFATYYALLVFPKIYNSTDIINRTMGPLGTATFNAANIPMSCTNNNCGAGATATILSQSVILNYSTAQMSNTYSVSYANFNGATGNISSSASSAFSALSAANSVNVTLPMSTTSGSGATTLNMIGQFGSIGNLAGKWSTLTTTLSQGSGVMRAGYQVKGQ